jgi:hypothetical protein
MRLAILKISTTYVHTSTKKVITMALFVIHKNGVDIMAVANLLLSYVRFRQFDFHFLKR